MRRRSLSLPNLTGRKKAAARRRNVIAAFMEGPPSKRNKNNNNNNSIRRIEHMLQAPAVAEKKPSRSQGVRAAVRRRLMQPFRHRKPLINFTAEQPAATVVHNVFGSGVPVGSNVAVRPTGHLLNMPNPPSNILLLVPNRGMLSRSPQPSRPANRRNARSASPVHHRAPRSYAS